MNYLKAVLKKDHETKIAELKKLIVLGEKLNKNTTPDKKKLEILLERENKTLGKKITPIKIEKTLVSKPKIYKKTNPKFNPIQSMYTFENTIVINYTHNISKDIVRFFELKQSPLHKDVYDLKGAYAHVRGTKLKMNGVNKIVVGQFKTDTLRVVIANEKNLKTSYSINNKQVVISIDDLKKKPTKTKIIPKTKNESIFVKKSDNFKNIYIDRKNSIKTVFTKNNTIVVQFNKNFSKRDLKYTAYKSNNKYQDIFDIKGKYKYAKPIKLKIDGLEKISIGQKNSSTLRIRVSDRKNYRVVYSLKKRELVIKILNLKTTNNINAIPALPYANFSSKTIVIDAGHGAKDVGAVGPNKRYEKVVTLKVAKYLYSILKQRGHKVYLTRHKDRFIKVNNRTILANKKNADIFISIHANSVPKSKAHRIQGIETFFLSPARSERAKRVAAKENKSDIRKMSNSTKKVFLESLNRPRITASHKLAIDTQAGMLQSVKKSYRGVKDSGVREGPFWVLVGAQMPSILIELGYISHPVESKRLYSTKYQKLLANGIANGVDSYFSKNP